MIKYACTDMSLLHFMDHCFYCVRVQFINKDCVVMMYKRLDSFVNGITQKKRFIVEIDFYVHLCKDTRPLRGAGTTNKPTRLSQQSLEAGHAVNRYLRRMTNQKAVAERLLQLNAIKL